MFHKMTALYPRRCGVITAVVLTGLLTAGGLPVSAQTDEPDGAPDPVYPFATGVCAGETWNDVRTDADIARVCLVLRGVNDGLGVYAFVKKAVGYDPGNPAGGGPEEAGLVSRWAMAEALTRTIEAAAETTLRAPSGEAEAFFADIGWLSAGTRRRIAQLYDLEVTKGTSEAGVYDPAGPVTRGQMALFFVRTLSAIEELDPDGLPEFGLEGTSSSSDPFSVVWEKEAERIASGLEEAEADRLDCRGSVGFRERVLGMPFVDVCGWDNDDERFPAIKLIYDLGVTIGVSAESEGRRYYRAAEPVTGGQMAMFLVRLLSHTNVTPLADLPAVGEVALPAVQQETETVFNTFTYPDEVKPGGNVRLEPDPSTRPPRELDYYRYTQETHPDNRVFHEQVGILEGEEILRVSNRFSLQIGDWYWNGPPGWKGRGMSVVVEFRTDPAYIEGRYPLTRVYTCRIWEDESEAPSYVVPVMLRVAPGVFRMTAQRLKGVGDCGLGDYDVPVPDGGYTENFPCDGTSERVTRLFAPRDVVLPECGT